MKILLVSCNPVVAPYPVYPLGMAVVANALRRAGHSVRQHDMLAGAFSLEKLHEAVAAEPPEMVGISFRNLDNVNACNEAWYVDQLSQIVAALREASAVPVVLGGPGFSVMPEQVLQASGADYGIVGEGERLVVELADRLARGERPEQRIWRSESLLDEGGMLSPAFDDAILEFYQKSGGVTPLQSKRGCPHRCAYCTYPLLEGHRIRPRDCEQVVDDVLALQAKGAKQIFFTDSIFNDSAGHYRKLVATMRRRGVRIPWTGFFRPELFEPEILEEMKATGLNAVELGSDATSDATLREMGKDFTFAEVKAVHDRLVGAQLTVSHYFMMGGPGETRETVREGIENVLQLRGAASFIFLGVRILPGTPLEARARQDGVLADGADLLRPTYYFSPAIERAWLHETLSEAFKKHRHVVYPPDAMDSGLAFLHRLGYTGMSIELLLKQSDRRASPSAT